MNGMTDYDDDYGDEGWGHEYPDTVDRSVAPDIAPGDQVMTPRVLVSGSVNITPGTAKIELVAGKVTLSVGQLTVSVAEEDHAPRIARAPAARLISVLGFVLTRSAYERIIAPYIAQEQHEYYEALLRNQLGHARFIEARMWLSSIVMSIWALVTPLFRLLAR